MIDTDLLMENYVGSPLNYVTPVFLSGKDELD